MPYDMENIVLQFEGENNKQQISSNNVSIIKADYAIRSSSSNIPIDEEQQQQSTSSSITTTAKATKDANKVWSRFSNKGISNFPKRLSDLSSSEKKLIVQYLYHHLIKILVVVTHLYNHPHHHQRHRYLLHNLHPFLQYQLIHLQ